MYNQQYGFIPFVNQDPNQQPTPMQTQYPGMQNLIQTGYAPSTVFNQFSAPVVQQAQPVMAPPINMGGLVEEAPNRQAVGLPMHSLVEPSAMTPKDGPVSTTTPVFNNLVGVDPNYQPQQSFGIQPLPMDVDRSMLPRPISVMDDATAHLSKADAADLSVGKKLNNWFTRLQEQKGDDFITSGKLTVDEVSKNAEKILEDMIDGKVDYIKQGPILITPIIIDTLINYCANKLAINSAIQYALGYVYNDYTAKQKFYDDPERMASLSVIDDNMCRNITQAISIVNQDIGVYDILYRKLSFVEATKNASSLFSLTNDLAAYKKQMKKRY